MVVAMNHHKAQCFFCTPYDSHVHSRIEREIIRNEFNEDSVWGFRIHSRRQQFLQAVYIEKKIFTEKIIDPFGNTTELERIAYNQIDFQLSTSQPQILIFQPPRNYRNLINQLAQFTDYTVAIKNKTVKLFDWVILLAEKGLEGVVNKVNIDPITYDKSTTGKLTLAGQSDLREKIVKLLVGKSYIVKNLNLISSDQFDTPAVELFSNGKVIFSRPVDSEHFIQYYDTFCKLTENAEQLHSPDGVNVGGADAESS